MHGLGSGDHGDLTIWILRESPSSCFEETAVLAERDGVRSGGMMTVMNTEIPPGRGLLVATCCAAIVGLVMTPAASAQPPVGLTAVPGIKVGHASMAGRPTGCSVVLAEAGAVGGVDVRGSAPGTRETDLLNPVNLVEKVHAVVLAGGSAFGLDAATGVMRYLEGRGVGFETGAGKVPIVPAAVLFDLTVGDAKIRPNADCGYRAAEAASAGRSGRRQRRRGQRRHRRQARPARRARCAAASERRRSPCPTAWWWPRWSRSTPWATSSTRRPGRVRRRHSHGRRQGAGRRAAADEDGRARGCGGDRPQHDDRRRGDQRHADEGAGDEGGADGAGRPGARRSGRRTRRSTATRSSRWRPAGAPAPRT